MYTQYRGYVRYKKSMNRLLPPVRTTPQRGFTMFELIVVISVIILVFGIAIAGFNRFNKRERLRQAGLTLKANLRYAQTKAFSVDKPTSGCTTFTGMRVSFTATSYTINHTCTEGVVGTGTTVTLQPGITLSPVPSTFTFIPLKGSISLLSGQTLTITNTTSTYMLTLSGNGDLSDNGFQ